MLLACPVHQFLLYQDGGAIDIGVKAASDTVNRDAIRMHLPKGTKPFRTERQLSTR